MKTKAKTPQEFCECPFQPNDRSGSCPNCLHPFKPSVDGEKVYNSMTEWYHPEIDYWEMLHKFRWTNTTMSKLMKYMCPLDHVDMFQHADMFNYDSEKKTETYGHQQKFQFWNKQFNDALERLLIQEGKRPKLILDVGAGDGYLSKILHDRGFNVVAIDNMRWPFLQRYFPVEEMSYGLAIKKYQPEVIISSWMPLNTDWTPGFRRTKSVKKYILIGEVEAACGGDWSEKKGWEMYTDEEATKYALCRTDSLWFPNPKNDKPDGEFMMHHSAVTVFERK